MEEFSGVDTPLQAMQLPRFSRRGVDRSAIEQILALAQRAPSGTNTQPWNVYVLQGPSLSRMCALASSAVAGLAGDAVAQAKFRALCDLQPGIGAWPVCSEVGGGDEVLSQLLSVEAQQQPQVLARHFRFLDAPVGLLLTLSRGMGLGSMLDYGMFLHNLRMAAQARGIQACVQIGWKGIADTVLAELEAPADMLLVGGVALGYADEGPSNVLSPAVAQTVHDSIVWHV